MVKRSTNNMHALDIRQLHRAGLLQSGRSSAWRWTRGGNTVASVNLRASTGEVILSYRTRVNGDAWQAMDYPVAVTWTPCNYGGQRPWWQCRHCGRRVAVLYGGRYYACRQCQNLNYESTRAAPDSKAFARADKLRKRLGWGAGVLNPMGGRPKGVHATTYLRLLNQLIAHTDAAFQNLDCTVERLTGKLGRIGRGTSRFG